MADGFIKLYRALLDDALWQICSPEQKVIMITILLKANHKINEWGWNGDKFKVHPGEFITSLDSLKKDCGKKISLQNLRSALAKFKKYGFLTEEVTKVNRKITVRNWNKYQITNIDTNKEVTKRSQRGNKEVTTNKNDKNDKNDKKYISSDLETKPEPVKITFNFTSSNWEGITEKDKNIWSEAYPACDVELELKKMVAWILGAGAKGHKSNWRKFIAGWLSRQQDSGGTKTNNKKDEDWRL